MLTIQQPVAINLSPQVEYITPEEMDILIEKAALGEDISSNEKGTGFARLKMTVQKDGAFCKVVFMNTERLDPIDLLTGTLTLVNSKGTVVGNTPVEETQLVFGVARVYDIYPLGGSFKTLKYNLVITEDGKMMDNVGEVTPK